ncbi:MAG: Rieske 2Fe-2S domain-containing protein [Pirellulales bacterium]|nr:Rieske 2Fe-2S domain-containing protein [Pirellulales bacterium]
MANPVEIWKQQKHPLDVWPDVIEYARVRTSVKTIPTPDLERMKWYGVFYRKRDTPAAYMLRIRLTANELSAVQAKEIARVAYDVGHGIVDITTRANIQVQGLAIESIPRALQRLEAVGLSCRQTGHDNVRNVFGHPLAGVDPEELYDTRPLCHQVTELILGRREFADLPRKFNIAFNGRADHSIHYWTQDLAFLAARQDVRVGFQVLVGGKQGQHPSLGQALPAFVFPAEAVDVARVVLEMFRELGSREKRDSARFRYLVETLGVDGVLAEIERRLGRTLEPSAAAPAPAGGYEDLIGWIPQRQPGRWTAGLCPAVGRLSALQLDGIAVAAQRCGSGRLRTTPEQGIAVLDVRGDARSAFAAHVTQFNLSLHVDSRVRNVVACTGKQFCNLAVTETKTHALQLIERLRQRSLELHGVRIHLSGCPSACGNHHTADIGLKGVRVKRLLGTREGFDVFLGGGVAGQLQLGAPYKTGVDAGQLPQLIEEVIREYYLRQRPGETFSDYWRCELRRRQPAAASEEEYHPPAWECEACGHRHNGVDPPVFCPQCTALRRHFARLEDEAASPASATAALADDAVATAASASGFAEAARVSAIPEGAGLAVHVNGRDVALFRDGDDVCALDALCPHAGGLLAEGTIDGGVVTCPLHGWRFNAANGAALAPSTMCVASYPVSVEGGKVLVQTQAPTTPCEVVEQA